MPRARLSVQEGIEPRVLLRSVSFEVAQTPVLQGDAVAIVGESSATGLSSELRWLPVEPAATLDVGLLARRHNRSPAVDRPLDAAGVVADALGWV